MHKLVIWLLLPAMLLNGLWIVCNPGTTDSAEQAEKSAHCMRICASLEASLGKICWILPGDASSSITIIDFGVAELPRDIVLQPVTIDEQLAAELPSPYWSPNLSKLTPPPRA